MKQAKKKQTATGTGTPVSGLRLPPEILAELRTHAEQMERTLVAQIRVALREWCKLNTGKLPVVVASQQSTTQPTGLRPAVPLNKSIPDKVAAIVEEDEGWEGQVIKR